MVVPHYPPREILLKKAKMKAKKKPRRRSDSSGGYTLSDIIQSPPAAGILKQNMLHLFDATLPPPPTFFIICCHIHQLLSEVLSCCWVILRNTHRLSSQWSRRAWWSQAGPTQQSPCRSCSHPTQRAATWALAVPETCSHLSSMTEPRLMSNHCYSLFSNLTKL